MTVDEAAEVIRVQARQHEAVMVLAQAVTDFSNFKAELTGLERRIGALRAEGNEIRALKANRDALVAEIAELEAKRDATAMVR
ncbi:MAG: hypothetical protein KIT36_14515 [Alphaproteobacteria bacterium]|nr:hypothetical protein [Alphaproteobacteria bacterium]